MFRFVAVTFLCMGFVTSGPVSADDATPNRLEIPKGFRAVTVRVVQRTAMSAFILPGFKYDLIGVFRGEQGKQESRVLLQNVLVLAVNSPCEGSNEKDDKEARNVKSPYFTVTVAVKPEDAKVLLLAAEKGEITMALQDEKK